MRDSEINLNEEEKKRGFKCFYSLNEVNETKLDNNNNISLWDKVIVNSATGLPESIIRKNELEGKAPKQISFFSLENNAKDPIISDYRREVNSSTSSLDSESSILSESSFQAHQEEDLEKFQNFHDCVFPLSFKKMAIKKEINAASFNKLISKKKEKNFYLCDICKKGFSSHAALGGHKAKNHPNSSKSFKNRQKIFNEREGLRQKKAFLKKLIDD